MVGRGCGGGEVRDDVRLGEEREGGGGSIVLLGSEGVRRVRSVDEYFRQKKPAAFSTCINLFSRRSFCLSHSVYGLLFQREAFAERGASRKHEDVLSGVWSMDLNVD